MNHTENNKLIAEFMRLEIINADIILYAIDEIAYPINKLQYHTSWDWLMPVVEKIESLNTNNNVTVNITERTFVDIFYKDKVFKTNNNNKSNGLYQAVIEFIKYYNNESKI